MRAAALVLAAALPALAQSDRVAWNQPAEPFRIIGNIYYVGTAELGCYLIATPAGNILLDGGLPESAAQIERNVERLGFRFERSWGHLNRDTLTGTP
jgi:metallo-beta-lactamase class B